jgi:hypothetical protein
MVGAPSGMAQPVGAGVGADEVIDPLMPDALGAADRSAWVAGPSGVLSHIRIDKSI